MFYTTATAREFLVFYITSWVTHYNPGMTHYRKQPEITYFVATRTQMVRIRSKFWIFEAVLVSTISTIISAYHILWKTVYPPGLIVRGFDRYEEKFSWSSSPSTSMVSSKTTTKDIINLWGSAAIVTGFFGMYYV